jgi:CheY-like chemotaxis protein
MPHFSPEQCEPIIVVEDDPVLRLALARDLTGTGFNVVNFSSGEAALTHLLLSVPVVRASALVTDIQLGGKLTGWGIVSYFPLSR